MADKPETRGTCAYCDEVVTRRGIDKHLVTCQKRQVALQASVQSPETLWRLQLQGSYNHGFWLELEIRGSATLEDLDEYLRGRFAWLECCDHLSQFTLGGLSRVEIDPTNPCYPCDFSGYTMNVTKTNEIIQLLFRK